MSGPSDEAQDARESLAEILASSRFLIAETLAGMAIHTLGHRLGGIRRELGRLCRRREVRDQRSIHEALRSLDSMVEESETDIRRVFDLVSRRPDEPACRVDLHSVIRHTVELWQPFLTSNRCQVTFSGETRDRGVWLPEQNLREILSALLVNAVQAQSTEVAITVSEADNVKLLPGSLSLRNALVVAVQDNGCGIASSHLDSIFEPTFTTRPEAAGTGLGLFIARSLARRAGGELMIDRSDEGPSRGACFCLVLPIRESTGD